MIGSLIRMNSPLFNDLALLGLRAVLGLTMLFAHGLGKLQSYSERASTWADPIGLGPELSLALAIFAEVGCALLLVLGAVTRLAVIPLIVTMAVAFFIVHGGDEWKLRELSFIYLAGYSALFFLGAGRFSVDGLLLKK